MEATIAIGRRVFRKHDGAVLQNLSSAREYSLVGRNIEPISFVQFSSCGAAGP